MGFVAKNLYFSPQFAEKEESPSKSGEVAEWLKAHAWKACIP